MNYRYIVLSASNSGLGSGFGSEFDNVFNYNTWFISNFLSRNVRKLNLPSMGNFNMISCSITSGAEFVSVHAVDTLDIRIHVEPHEIDFYHNTSPDKERFEFYLGLLEKGYNLAVKTYDIPKDHFLQLHQSLRDEGYRNEWLFKKKQFRELGIKILLEHVLTYCDYKLRMTISDLNDRVINSDFIFTTYPDDIFFNKTIRNISVVDGNLVVSDFSNSPQLECSLDDLKNGIIQCKCLNEQTMKYMPNESNKHKFERLKW